MTVPLIPKNSTRIEHRVSNSRFIATLGRASTVDEARAFIRSIREEIPDATHHVYAFRVGHGASITEGVSDDGEPAGTSGPPVLSVLRGREGLGDAVIVVTRYFGGTKLGTGGLVSAYGDSAKRVLGAAEFEEKVERVEVNLAVPYGLLESVKRSLESHSAIIDHQDFDSDVHLRFRVPLSEFELLSQGLKDLSSGRLQLTVGPGSSDL